MRQSAQAATCADLNLHFITVERIAGAPEPPITTDPYSSWLRPRLSQTRRRHRDFRLSRFCGCPPFYQHLTVAADWLFHITKDGCSNQDRSQKGKYNNYDLTK